jgi:solute carrier family 25 protein 33/36
VAFYGFHISVLIAIDSVVKTRLQLSAKKIDKSAPTTSTASSVLPKPIANSAAALSQSAPVAGVTAARGSILGPAATMTMDILKQDGIRGLYKGLSASYIGVSEGVIQWTLYEVSFWQNPDFMRGM